MTAVTFDAFIRFAAKGAAINFARHKGVEPIFITVSETGDWQITALSFIWQDNADRKDIVFAAMRGIAKEKRAVRCAFISEAWALEGSNETVRHALAEGSLERVPGRREIVSIVAEDRSEGQRNAWMEIVRPDGRDPYLLTLHIEQFSESYGRGVGLLPAETAAGHA
jgi:hypothetical protein